MTWYLTQAYAPGDPPLGIVVFVLCGWLSKQVESHASLASEWSMLTKEAHKIQVKIVYVKGVKHKLREIPIYPQR